MKSFFPVAMYVFGGGAHKGSVITCLVDHDACVLSTFPQVPRVFIGEECVGGGSDLAELDQSGKLQGMLQTIGALQ